MTEKKPPRTGIVPSDMDAQGNVVLWDHGPADAKHQAPVPVILHAGDAGHAMMIDPERYALEPFELDEDEIAGRVQDMKAKREAARDFAQHAIDRRNAIAAMMSDRAQARLVEQEPEEKAI